MSRDTILGEAIETLLSELVDGGTGGACYVLNPDDRGILRSLDRLSATEAVSAGASRRRLHRGTRRSPLLRVRTAQPIRGGGERLRQHLAYHLGAIRQVNRGAAGPPAVSGI